LLAYQRRESLDQDNRGERAEHQGNVDARSVAVANEVNQRQGSN
jgi:hypothetical protein